MSGEFTALGGYRDHIVTDPKLVRPPEANTLVGDASKARRVLGWGVQGFVCRLIRMMVDADMERVRKELAG